MKNSQRYRRNKTSNLRFCQRHEAYGESVSPRFSINKYLPLSSLWSLRTLCETSFHLVAATPLCEQQVA